MCQKPQRTAIHSVATSACSAATAKARPIVCSSGPGRRLFKEGDHLVEVPGRLGLAIAYGDNGKCYVAYPEGNEDLMEKAEQKAIITIFGKYNETLHRQTKIKHTWVQIIAEK